MTTPLLDTPAATWHIGERKLQEAAGVGAWMADVGPSVIRDHMGPQHRAFFSLLPHVVLGTVDEDGRVWATLRANRPGFLLSPDPRVLDVTAPREADDPASAGLAEGNAIGMLGIDLLTRRRGRMNGRVATASANGFRVLVEQSFGNCPQYIRQRRFTFTRDASLPPQVGAVALGALDARARALIAGADTFFVASYVDLPDGERQVDVSHRGGKPGFVRVDADGRMTIPDFSGNLFFNTLGNFMVNPRAGLVFTDFSTGDLLQLSGSVEIIDNLPDGEVFEGAERFWRFTPQAIVRREGALPLRWEDEPDGESPGTSMTGTWHDTASAAAP